VRRILYGSVKAAFLPPAGEISTASLDACNQGLRYTLAMSPTDKKLLKQIAAWPEADQEELAEVAREIESRRTGIYRLSDAERAAVRQGIDAANAGHFAPEDEMEEYFRLHRSV
jgi:predicted transcriptional regulator